MKKARDTEVLWIAILLAIIVAIVIFAVRATRRERAACEERGGTIVNVHNSQTGEWFCQEPR
jgi:cytochrome c-type biogenesis protein CcmH/NrfF